MYYVFAAIGILLAIGFIVLCFTGRKYDYIFANLNESDFPVKELYSVGFQLSTWRLFRLKPEKEEKLKCYALNLYDPQYAEYYAKVAWSEALTLVYLIGTVTILACVIMSDMKGLFLLAGGFLCLLAYTYSMENMHNRSSEQTEYCEADFPEIISSLAILVNSGMMLRDAWQLISQSGNRPIHQLMRKSVEDLNNGVPEMTAYYSFGQRSNSAEIKKFTGALIQSLEMGGGELGGFLANQSSELWNLKRQHMLQNGEKAATKLLLPIVLIFGGILLIIMVAAFAGSLF